MHIQYQYISSEYHRRYQRHIFKRRRIIRNDSRTMSRRYDYKFEVTKLKAIMSTFLREFNDKGYIDQKYTINQGYIKIPTYFSFKYQFNDSIKVYKEFLSEFLLGSHTITIDFSNCKHADIANFALLNICRQALLEFYNKYNANQYKQIVRKILALPSHLDNKTNKYLVTFKYIPLSSDIDDGSQFMPLDLMRGRHSSSYRGNVKSGTASIVSSFVKKAASPYGYELTTHTESLIEGYVGEVLNNAEDHSLQQSEWYVNGMCFHEIQHGVDVIEVNLAIMNIGPSMYEGFEKTKEKNITIYQKLEKYYEIHKKQFSITNHFERENLFMLYMLNDGISRLKYEDSSRGNGTMNFIDAFIKLGDYGEENEQFLPCLNIISGHSVLTCDSRYKPFVQNKVHRISLNKEQDQTKLPDKNYLHYNSSYFPGTILECKIYLNKEHIQKHQNIINI